MAARVLAKGALVVLVGAAATFGAKPLISFELEQGGLQNSPGDATLKKQKVAAVGGTGRVGSLQNGGGPVGVSLDANRVSMQQSSVGLARGVPGEAQP